MVLLLGSVCNCEMVLVLLDRTRMEWAGECVFHARFAEASLEGKRREKLRATSYLQNFSCWHASGLHSKCLLLVASCDQSSNSSLHLLHIFFLTKPDMLSWLLLFHIRMVVVRKLLAALPKSGIIFCCISMMLLHHHSSGSGRLVLCNAKNHVSSLCWKKCHD